MATRQELNRWIYATQEEIENMTYQDMIDLLEDEIECGKRGGDFSPRAHRVHLDEVCVHLLKKEIAENGNTARDNPECTV